MAFTLISVLCIDCAGFTLIIKGGTCKIRTSKINVIGHIPQVRGLYHVLDGGASSQSAHSANITVKQMSINDLHQQMEHVNHEDLHCMVDKGMVTGINLDMPSKPKFCETCIKSKATHMPFLKESKTKHKAYGDKSLPMSGVQLP